MFKDSRITLKDVLEELPEVPKLPTVHGEQVEPGYYLVQGSNSLSIYHLKYGDSLDTNGLPVKEIDKKDYSLIEDIWNTYNKKEGDV